MTVYIVTTMVNGFFETSCVFKQRESADRHFNAERLPVVVALEDGERIETDSEDEFVVYRGLDVTYQIRLMPTTLQEE